jgi:hypothetical protein
MIHEIETYTSWAIENFGSPNWMTEKNWSSIVLPLEKVSIFGKYPK